MARTSEGNLVEAARSGDSQAFGQLFDTWFDRVHDLSRRIVKDPGTAGEVAQDAFLTAWTRLETLDDPDAFGGWLLRIARNASLNRLTKERRSVALDSETMTTLSDLDAPDHDPLASMDQAARVNLVWDAAAALGERDMSILDLHLRHGLGAPELADELGTTANNAHQILFTLRKRLGTNVRALVLWRAGRPACDDLRRTLAAAGIGTFDKQAVKVIERHAAVCDDCSTERTERLNPAALFGAAPVVAAPILLRSQTASALEAAGVPMSGSASLGGTGTGGGADGGSGSGSGSGNPSGPTNPAGLVDPTHLVFESGAGAEPDPALDGVASHPHGPADGPRSRGIRVLGVAAVALVLIGLAVVLSGAFGDPEGVDELAAGAATSTTRADDTNPTSQGPEASGPPETATGGGFVIGDAPGTGHTPVPSGSADITDSTATEAAPSSPASPDVDPTTAPTDRPTTPSITPTTTTPSTSTPSTPSTSSTTSTTRPEVPAPIIVGFSAVSVGNQCPQGLSFDVRWETENATEAIISVSGEASQSYSPSGSTSICVPRRAAGQPMFLLVASGPGGEALQSLAGVYAIP